jgi:ribosomal protein S18 acetylase RimI-like enzyme
MADPLIARLPLQGERTRLEAGHFSGPKVSGVIVRMSDGLRAGTFSFVEEGDALQIDQLCVDAPARGYGLGSEAARLLREAAAESGFTTLRAAAPPDLGLAVYFWTRMGLHPLHGPAPNGGIWFERTLHRW